MVPLRGDFKMCKNWNMSEKTVPILFVGDGFLSLCITSYLPFRPTLLGDFPACCGRRNASPTPLQIGICRAVKVRGRLDALPPAFTRGVARVAHTGAGGSPSSTFVSQKGAKNKNSNHRKIILFDALVPGIRTPPVPALARGHPPHKCGGQGV